MKNCLISPLLIFFCSIIFFSFFSACVKHQETTNKYAIYILGKEGKEYIIESNDLEKGEVFPEKKGSLTSEVGIDRGLIIKNNFYYNLRRKDKLFGKYSIENNNLKLLSSVKLDNFGLENYYWIAKDTLLLTGLNDESNNDARYYLFSTKNDLKIISNGKLPIPKPKGTYKTSSIGFIEFKNNKLFIGYTYHEMSKKLNYTTNDTIFVAQITYPNMQLLDIEKDNRSVYPGGINTVQNYSFNNEKGDFYFMSCPGIALGNSIKKSTAIFRIKKQDNFLDKNYFFDISKSEIANHAYGIWYLGNNKAIIRTEQKGLYTNFSNHHNTFHFSFYLLDLEQKTTKKLNLPLDKGTRRECVLVEQNKAYIAVNAGENNNYIWVYDIQSGDLKKGLKLSGDTDYILRIDKKI